MAQLARPLRLCLLAASALALPGAATPSLQSGPGCIAAIISIPIGPIESGETVTFTDGSLISPTTKFLSRTWNFGDGAVLTSNKASETLATHTYFNAARASRTFTIRLSERTGQDSCAAVGRLEVTP